MHRTLFYLSAALLAFGIGLFVVFNSYVKVDEKLITAQPMKEVKVEKIAPIFNFNKKEPTFNFNEKKVAFSKQTVSFKCEDKSLLTVWNHLRKNKDFKETTDEQIKKGEINDCSEIIQVADSVDLNNNKVNESIVVGRNMLVNGAQNRAIWIVQKFGKANKILLEDSAEDYEIKKNATNGYKDFFIKHHMSCCSSYQSTYKFIKGKYRESKCLFVDYGTTGEKVVKTCAEENARIEKDS